MANNYIADSVIGAIDTVVKGAIRDLKYDQTIEAIVTSTAKAADGIYTVKSENASFEAYASSRYYVNDTVYVMIPQGDFKKQKFITGRKVDELSTQTTFTLKLPFDDFIGLQDLTEGFEFPSEELGYVANHGLPEASGEGMVSGIDNYKRQGSIITAEEDADAIKANTYRKINLIGRWERPEEDKSPLLVTKLGVSFDVRSLLHEYFLLGGQYGIRLSVEGYTKPTETTSSTLTKQDIYFTNKDMYGDTYAYFLAATQQKVFDISSMISLKSIEIYFWQDFNFIDEQRKLIPWKNEYVGQVPANIFLSNFNVQLGLTTDDINEERVFLYTYDDIYYGKEPESLKSREELDSRTLHFAWVHYDHAEDKFILVNNSDKLNRYKGKIFWYQLEYNAAPPSEEEAGELYWRLAPPNWKYIETTDYNQFSLIVKPSIDKSKEKYLAIVSFNGTYEKTEALTFTNIIDVDSLNEALAANKNYVFKFYRPATAAEKALYEGNETNVFSFGNNALDPSVGNPTDWLIEDKTIGNFLVYDENNRVLKNSDERRYSDIEYYAVLHLLTKDSNGDEEIEHYSPLYADTESNFSAEIVFPQNFSMITEVPFDNTDPYFGGTKFNNKYRSTICKFKINYFWNVNYKDNVLTAIVNRSGNTYYINKEMVFGQSGSQGSEYTIRIALESGSNYAIVKNQEFSIAAYVYDRYGNMLTENDGSQKMIFNWETIGDATIASQSISDIAPFVKNKVTARVSNDCPPIFKVTVTGAADYPISAIKGFILTDNAALTQEYTVMCPNRVEYKSDGSMPFYDTSEFVIEDTNGVKKYPVWQLLPQNDKYFELKMSNYAEVTIPTNAGEKRRPGYTGYKLVSIIKRGNNSNKVIPYYWEPSMENHYMYLSAQFENESYIRQAIPLVHNVYASSLINSWDGSLTLDEESGAVLSTMMSAGAKDSQNKFTGVIMGDWEQEGDSSIDVPGLYGFARGEQTFGLKTDGTGFIGKASAGQIQFDGNQALISSYDKNFYLNLNPMRYTLSESPQFTFALDENTQYSYSPYFLYAKTAKTADVTGNLSAFTNDNSWTTPFFNDEDNDYFIVDPNNGILTTGGIIAKYGKIGNWMISKEGLYQKADNGKYMYLGFSEYNSNSTEKQRYAIFAGNQDKTNPVYSVTWDGTLFTRKGLIANTWTIDDKSLTYKKNNSIIYIGTENEDTKGRAVDITDTRRWAFSASDKFVNEETDYLINFGVSLSGELYAQLGTIGGWTITKSSLESKIQAENENGTPKVDENNNPIYSSTIELDTERNALVFNGGSTVISGDGRILLGQSSANGVQGKVYLANYALIGQTGDGINGILSSFGIANGTPAEVDIAGENNDSGYSKTDLSYSAMTLQSATGVITQSNISVHHINNFKILDESDEANNTSTGIIVATGSSSSNSDIAGLQRAIIMYPTGYDKTIKGSATLGLDTDRWNLLGDYINCHDLQTDNLNITSESLYMEGNKVATELWVLNQLKDVYDQIKSTGGGAASGIKGAFGGINKMTDNLNLIFNGKRQFVDAVVPSYKDGKLSIAFGYNQITYTQTLDGGGGSSSVSGIAWGANMGTATAVTLTAYTIPFSSADGTDTIASYVHNKCGHQISCKANEGEITITLGDWIGKKISEATFNIAETQFYKDHAFKEFEENAGSGSSGFGSSCSISAISISGKTLGIKNLRLKMVGEGAQSAIQLDGSSGLAQYNLNTFYNNTYAAGRSSVGASGYSSTSHPGSSSSSLGGITIRQNETRYMCITLGNGKKYHFSVSVNVGNNLIA